MKRAIVGFDQDEAGDWRAVLACGHRQHVRHDPPLVSRPWVLTEEGRRRFLGYGLDCKLCDDQEVHGVTDRIREKAPDVPEAEVLEDVAEAIAAIRSER